MYPEISKKIVFNVQNNELPNSFHHFDYASSVNIVTSSSSNKNILDQNVINMIKSISTSTKNKEI